MQCKMQRCKRKASEGEFCFTHAVKRADYITSLRDRTDAGVCRRCGSDRKLQWAHVHSRRYMAIRWNPDNTVVLCSACHTYFTHHPLEWEQWCRDEGIPWDELRVLALTSPPMHPATVMEGLNSQEGTSAGFGA